MLLSNGADVNSADTNGCTPIMFALQYKNPGLCELFVDYGADLGALDSSGRMVFEYAPQEFVEYYIDKFELIEPIFKRFLARENQANDVELILSKYPAYEDIFKQNLAVNLANIVDAQRSALFKMLQRNDAKQFVI